MRKAAYLAVLIPFLMMNIVVIGELWAGDPPKRELQDTDLISVVLTVKTAKQVASSITTQTIPTDDVQRALLKALVRSIEGVDSAPPPPVDVNQEKQ